MTAATLAPPPDDDRSRYTALQVHPSSLPLVIGLLSSHNIPLKRIPDGPSRQRRYIAGQPADTLLATPANELGSRRPAPTPVTPAVNSAAAAAGLSRREEQVLRGMAVGFTNAEIGRELHLSEDTIKTHARRLFTKLGARDRANAVFLASQRGMLGGAA
ncbi:helix-turn-helix transcriptional regulator [Amycolatopsis thermoflava]|uniref:helix-turn-helix transcriptional regulator n=1 Tax=Amycolatopsis thermoflava TaxID=84480 RepID=UPI0038231424